MNNSAGATVEVHGLTVLAKSGHVVLRDITLSAPAGGRLGLVGQSGKTTFALSLLGHIRPGLRHAGGEVTVAGRDVLRASSKELRGYRRTVVSYFGQDPAAALTPSIRIGDQVAELAADRSEEAIGERLRAMGIPGDRALPAPLSARSLRRPAAARGPGPGARLEPRTPRAGRLFLLGQWVKDAADRSARRA